MYVRTSVLSRSIQGRGVDHTSRRDHARLRVTVGTKVLPADAIINAAGNWVNFGIIGEHVSVGTASGARSLGQLAIQGG